MKHILRICVLLLACLTVIGSFSACRENTGEVETQAKDTQESGEIEQEGNDLPVKKLSKKDFVVYDANDHPELHFNFSDEYSTESEVLRALYERDSYLEEHYGILLSYESMDPKANLQQIMNTFSSAGDRPYDMLYSTVCSSAVEGGRLPSLAITGILAELTQLSELDLNGTWWSPWINSQLSYGGKTYFTTGDIAASVYEAPGVVYANSEVLIDYGLMEDPTAMYDIVKSGEWTLDYMIGIGKDLTVDVNDDGKFTTTDFYAFVGQGNELTTNVLLAGMGFDLSVVTDDGIEINSNTLLLDNMVSKLKSILMVPAEMSDQNDVQYVVFAENRALFMTHFIESASHGLRDMKTDFLILPTPKWNTEQKEYRSCVSGWVNCYVAVPSFDLDNAAYAEDIGYVLEVMARASYDMVRPVAFDSVIKYKNVRDEGSYEMLDIIFNSLYLDYQCIYNFGSVSTVLRNVVFRSEELGSAYTEAKRLATSEMARIGVAWLNG